MAKAQSIRQYHKFRPLNLHTNIIDAYMQAHELRTEYSIVDPGLLVGIEVEVEMVKNPFYPTLFWKLDEDTSLRNYGREYISWPLRGNQIEYALKYLFTNLTKSRQFTGRCSTHVHMNVRTMTPEQISNMVQLYCLFEHALFGFIGEHRNNNIHCVPLMESNWVSCIPYIKQNYKFNREIWDKYCAINILPVGTQGTVEFRHLHGTDNVEKIITWINLLMCIKKYAINSKDILNEIKSLNSNSDYYGLASRVFKEYYHKLTFSKESIAIAVRELLFTNSKYDIPYFKINNNKIKEYISKVKKPKLDWGLAFGEPKPTLQINVNEVNIGYDGDEWGKDIDVNDPLRGYSHPVRVATYKYASWKEAGLYDPDVDTYISYTNVQRTRMFRWWVIVNKHSETVINYQDWLNSLTINKAFELLKTEPHPEIV